jgi:anti-sigma factor RsiW
MTATREERDMSFRRRRRRLRLIAVAFAAMAVGAPSALATDDGTLLTQSMRSSVHERVGTTALNDRAHQPVRAAEAASDVRVAAGGGDEGFSWADAGVGAGVAAAGAMVAGAAMVALRQARRSRPAV